jgi:hypothetical protein
LQPAAGKNHACKRGALGQGFGWGRRRHGHRFVGQKHRRLKPRF